MSANNCKECGSQPYYDEKDKRYVCLQCRSAKPLKQMFRERDAAAYTWNLHNPTPRLNEKLQEIIENSGDDK